MAVTRIYHDAEGLCRAIAERLTEVPIESIGSDPTLTHLMGLWEAYRSALEESKDYGWIGVGCITFAQNKLVALQELDKLRSFDEYGHYGENNPPVGGEE